MNNNPDEMKQVIVIRTDLKMRKGKMISQACHASLGAMLKMASKQTIGPDNCGHPECIAYLFKKDSYVTKWLEGIFTKITCRVESEEELLEIYDAIKYFNFKINSPPRVVPVILITDAGLTEFHGIPTNTCIAIGPAPIAVVDQFTKDLKLL